MNITYEDILTMEHDILRKALKEAREQSNDPNGDMDIMTVASDFFIYAGAISDFVEEVIGDDDRDV